MKQGQKPVAIILDRDGVINVDSPDYILSAAQWQPVPGSLHAIARLHQAGIPLALASNQSAVGRGMLSQEGLEAIHAKMMQMISDAGGGLDDVEYCPHAPDDGCSCRKPLPGLLQQALRCLSIEPSNQVVMIGDSLRDVQSAVAAGVCPLLVQSGYGNADEILHRAKAMCSAIQSFPDLSTAVDAILAGEG